MAADSLIKESKSNFDPNYRFIYKDLNKITSDLKNKNLTSLIEWCKSPNITKELANLNSSLYFESLKLNVRC